MNLKDSVKRFLRLGLVDPDRGIERIDQSPEMAALASEIRDEYQRRKEERRPFELQWRLNQNFLGGNQYCDILAETGEVVDYPALSDDEQRSVYNQIAPIIETRLSKLSRVQPGMTVRPLTADTSDVTTAKVSTQLLKSTFVELDMTHKQMMANAWAEITGAVFFKSVWDTRAGRIMGYVDGKPVYEGDVNISVVPAYEIFPASCYIDSMDEQDSIIHARVYTTREILDRWGILVEGREMNVLSMESSGMLPGGNGYNPSMQQLHDHQINDAELVLEYYEKPSRDFLNGRHVIVIGDYVVHCGDLPFRTGNYYRRGYPFARQLCLAAPGLFFGSTIIERLIPLQRDYNAVKNRINEHIVRMAVGNPVVEQGSLVNDELLDVGFLPGQVVEYRAGTQPPGWMQVQEIPQSLFSKLTEMRSEFIDISGVSEMSRSSQSPGYISSGTALEILKEQDDTRLTLTAENIRMAIQTVGQQWLRLFKQFVVAPRITRISGEDAGDITTVIWMASEITSDDVVVDTDNEMTNTPAQRKQLALELIQTGMFNDPDTQQMTRETRAKLMEVFKLGNWEHTIDMDDLHSARARREQMELERHKLPRIMELDNHSLHVQEHIKYALSAEFRRLSDRMPDMAQAMLAHIDGHKQLAVQQAMQLSGAPGMVAQGESLESAINKNVIRKSTNLNGSQPK